MSEEQQKENVRRILALAKVYIAEGKVEALKRGDIAQAVSIASREGQIEHYFEKKGITVE